MQFERRRQYGTLQYLNKVIGLGDTHNAWASTSIDLTGHWLAWLRVTSSVSSPVGKYLSIPMQQLKSLNLLLPA